jgi:hypothetical protein
MAHQALLSHPREARYWWVWEATASQRGEAGGSATRGGQAGAFPKN